GKTLKGWSPPLRNGGSQKEPGVVAEVGNDDRTTKLVDSRQWTACGLDTDVKGSREATGLFGSPLQLVRRRICAQAKHEFGFDGGESPFEHGEFHQLIGRREPDSAPENRTHETIFAESLQPRLADAAHFPARDEVGPQCDGAVLIGVSNTQSRRDAARKVRERR